MNKSDGFAYLNRFIKEGKDFVYSGPAFLYKYRSFDQFTYEMLKEKYLYLCPADKLDDETECISSIDTNNIVDLENNNLKRTGLEQIIRMIRPYCSEENYEHVRYMIYRTSTGDGRVRNSFLLDLMPELQQLVPNVDLTPFFNAIVNLPDQLEKPEIKDQFIQGIITILHRDKIRICSLGEQDDIEDLWNRYGGKHTGYCVEYKMKTYSAEEPLLPVIYEYERQTNVILALVNNFISQMVTILSDGKIPVDISQYLRLFVSKYLKWEEQKEWRIIGLSKERVDAPEISKIIIGSDASEENKKQMMDFCEANGINCVVEQTNRDI